MTFSERTLENAPFENFAEASKGILALLRSRADMGLWMVTRTSGTYWHVLSSLSTQYDIEDGDTLAWSDSFCNRMVKGEGPRVAPDSDKVQAYRDAPVGRQLPIGSYVGMPITLTNGELFGTLCAIDPKKKDPSLINLESEFNLAGRLLSTIVSLEIQRDDGRRNIERLIADIEVDPITNLHNDVAFERWCAFEDHYSRSYGSPVGVIFLDFSKDVAHMNRQDAGVFAENMRMLGTEISFSLRPSDFACKLQDHHIALIQPNTHLAYTSWQAEHVQAVCNKHMPFAEISWSQKQPRATIAETITTLREAPSQAMLNPIFPSS